MAADKDKETKAIAAPRFDPDQILEQIKSLSRQPFQETLSRLLSAEPTTEQVAAFAAKFPDRWAQCAQFLPGRAGSPRNLTWRSM